MPCTLRCTSNTFFCSIAARYTAYKHAKQHRSLSVSVSYTRAHAQLSHTLCAHPTHTHAYARAQARYPYRIAHQTAPAWRGKTQRSVNSAQVAQAAQAAHHLPPSCRRSNRAERTPTRRTCTHSQDARTPQRPTRTHPHAHPPMHALANDVQCSRT